MLIWTDWLGSLLHRSNRTALALLAANLLPLLLVAAGLWDLQRVMLLYWLENGVIGLYNIVRIVSSRDAVLPARLFIALFFTVHYGGFFLGHGLFLMAMLKLPANMNDPVSLLTVLPSGIAPMLLLLFLSHGYSLAWHYFHEGEYKTATTKQLMARPYGRVVILHLTIIGGGFAALALDEPKILLAGLVVLKTAIDLFIHVRSHLRYGPAPAAAKSPASG